MHSFLSLEGEKNQKEERKIVTTEKKTTHTHIHKHKERGREREREKMSQAAKKLIPLLDRVLVERAVAATKTSGGILLPETVGSKVRFFGFSLLLVVVDSSFSFFFFSLRLPLSSSSFSSSSVVLFVESECESRRERFGVGELIYLVRTKRMERGCYCARD